MTSLFSPDRSGLGLGPNVEAISSGDCWRGVHLETGHAERAAREDMMVNGHFLSMNNDAAPLVTEVRDETDGHWIPCVRAPGAFRIQPEGRPHSLRYRGPRVAWAGAIIDGGVLDTVMGGHYVLTPGLNVVDPVLEHLFRALLAALLEPGPEPEMVRGLVRNFLIALALRHGSPSADSAPKSGLTEGQLVALEGWIRERLDTRLTVADIARRVGLSAVHFSREFKRAKGRTPWEYVVHLRLDRARALLLQGETVSETALQCGFFDQAHLTRLFKQRFASTPSAFVRQHRVLA